MHAPFSPRLSCASSRVLDEEEDYFESVESLKQSSASLDLHASGSCLLLLPCGLLPEELAELEGCSAASMHVEAAVPSLTLSCAGEGPPSPHTPLGSDPPLLLRPDAAAAGLGAAPLGRASPPGNINGRAGDANTGEGAQGIAGMDGIELAFAAREPDALPVEPAALG